MKKRLLALALCLVMMTSLLPVTALADSLYPIFSGLEDNETYCGEVQFSVSVEGDVGTVIVHYNIPPNGPFNIINADGDGKYTLPAGIGLVRVEAKNRIDSTDFSKSIYVTVNNGQHTWTGGTSVGNGKHSRSCSNCPATKTEACVDRNGDHLCDDCGASVHTWSYEVSKAGDSLTATCIPNCTIGEVSVKLNAHSVTLPESPFNATVETVGDYKEVFSYGDIFYRYKDPTNGWVDVDDPKTFTPKPGEYQAGIWVYGLPGNGEVAARATSNDDGTNQGGKELLFVKYTAVDPAITAQTGDNRPIELMLAGVVVFSALAAAAFVADSKRRSRQ